MPLRCTETSLVLRCSLPEVPADVREDAAAWLEAHDIDATRLAVGTPVHRDPSSATLTWHEETADGVELRQRYLPLVADGTWPAPFPASLRETSSRLGKLRRRYRARHTSS